MCNTRVEPISVGAPVLAISGGTWWRCAKIRLQKQIVELGYCFGNQKEKNLIRDPAQGATNSRKSTLIALVWKVFGWRSQLCFRYGLGCWFSFGVKIFRRWVCEEWKRRVMQACQGSKNPGAKSHFATGTRGCARIRTLGAVVTLRLKPKTRRIIATEWTFFATRFGKKKLETAFASNSEKSERHEPY